MSDISAILKFLREEKKLSMEEMANELKSFNVSPSKSMISRWETGKSEPSMEYARILSKYFNVSLDYLLGLSEKKILETKMFTIKLFQVKLIHYLNTF